MIALLCWLCCIAQSCALRVRLPNQKSNSKGVLYVNVQIDKAGASTMGTLMKTMADRHGWSGIGCKAHSPNEDPEKLNPACIDAPSRFLMNGAWGTCNAYKGLRPCEHVVVLREPIARMISAYNYFCKSCSDEKKYCGRMFQPASCPNLSIVEFTRRYANIYTRKFMAAKTANEKSLHGGDDFNDFSDAGFDYELESDDWYTALLNLTKPDVHVFRLEDEKKLSKLGLMLNETFQEGVQLNEHRHSYTPDSDELRQMKRLLMYDRRVYASLFTEGGIVNLEASAPEYVNEDKDDRMELKI